MKHHLILSLAFALLYGQIQAQSRNDRPAGKWEIGVDIKPLLTDGKDPQTLLLRRHIGAHTALRFGLGFSWQKDSVFDVAGIWTPINNIGYVRREKKIVAGLSIGAQWEKPVNERLKIYISGDLNAGVSRSKFDGITRTSTWSPFDSSDPGLVNDTANSYGYHGSGPHILRDKEWILGATFSVGAKIRLIQQVYFTLESSLNGLVSIVDNEYIYFDYTPFPDKYGFMRKEDGAIYKGGIRPLGMAGILYRF